MFLTSNWKTKSMWDLRRRDGQSTLKRIRKSEKLHYRLRKAELGLEICYGVETAMSYLKSSSMLIKLLQEEIRHKKSNIRFLKKTFNSNHFLLQYEISFTDFAYVSSLFLRSNNRILDWKKLPNKKN